MRRRCGSLGYSQRGAPGSLQAEGGARSPAHDLPAAKPVVFLKALDDVSAEERGTLALQCEISDPQARVVWRKDGVELVPSDKYDFLHTAGTRGLVVHDLSWEDTGLYTCSVGSEETSSRVSVHGAWLCGLGPRGGSRSWRRGRMQGQVRVQGAGPGPWWGGGPRDGSGTRRQGGVHGAGAGSGAGLGPWGGSGSKGRVRVQETGPGHGAGAGAGAGLGLRGGARSLGRSQVQGVERAPGGRAGPWGEGACRASPGPWGGGGSKGWSRHQEAGPGPWGGAGSRGESGFKEWSRVQGRIRVHGAELSPGARPSLGAGPGPR